MASWRDSRDLGDEEETEKRREDSANGQLFRENDEEGPSRGIDESNADRTEFNEVVWLKQTKFAPVLTVWLDICLLQLKSFIFAVMVWSWASTFGRSLTGGSWQRKPQSEKMYHSRAEGQLFKQGQRSENSKRWEETSSGYAEDFPRNHSTPSFARVREEENFFLQVPWLQQNLCQVLASQGAHENSYWGKALLVSLEQLQLEVFFWGPSLMIHQLHPSFYFYHH